MNDFYGILGVSKDATKDEIKKAYRKLAQEHHPDKGGSEKKFHAINLAHEVLTDEEKRGKYDRGEPIFDTKDPEAFLRSRALQLFEAQVNNKQFHPKYDDIFKPMIQQCKVMIEQLPVAVENLKTQVDRIQEIRDRIEGDNTEIYVNTLEQKIKGITAMIENMPKEVEQLEKVISYIEKTKYRKDERPQPSQGQVMFRIGSINGSF